MSLLRAEQLSKSFGGTLAIDALSFSLDPGRIHSVIGPNGAGKTTLFNLVTGVYRPAGGTVWFDDREITGLPTHEIAARGVSRTFQNLQIFYNMTAIENVMVGRHLHASTWFLPSLLGLPGIRRSNRECREIAAELLDFVGLSAVHDRPADQLPYGSLKRLEIARALATEPGLLMLDEPAAGCNAAETREIDKLIGQIAARGVTVVLVEHDMRLVMGISDHILVLNHGRMLAEGPVDEIRGNPDVVAAYLGAQAAGGQNAA